MASQSLPELQELTKNALNRLEQIQEAFDQIRIKPMKVAKLPDSSEHRLWAETFAKLKSEVEKASKHWQQFLREAEKISVFGTLYQRIHEEEEDFYFTEILPDEPQQIPFALAQNSSSFTERLEAQQRRERIRAFCCKTFHNEEWIQEGMDAFDLGAVRFRYEVIKKLTLSLAFRFPLDLYTEKFDNIREDVKYLRRLTRKDDSATHPSPATGTLSLLESPSLARAVTGFESAQMELTDALLKLERESGDRLKAIRNLMILRRNLRDSYQILGADLYMNLIRDSIDPRMTVAELQRDLKSLEEEEQTFRDFLRWLFQRKKLRKKRLRLAEKRDQIEMKLNRWVEKRDAVEALRTKYDYIF